MLDYSKCVYIIHIIGCHLLKESAHFGYDRWAKIWYIFDIYLFRDCLFLLIKSLNNSYSTKKSDNHYKLMNAVFLFISNYLDWPFN